jgi:tetratricopeptide (TPR) repeat protein
MRNKIITYFLIVLSIVSYPIFSVSQNNQPASPIIARPQEKKPDSKQQLAIEYYRQKEYEKAAELFQQLYNQKRSSFYYSYLYNCYVQLKKYDDAGKIARQQRKSVSNNYRYIIDEAYVIDLSGNKKKAERILQKLIDDMPSDRNKITVITNSLIAKGYADLAVRAYMKAGSQNTDNYSYGFELANAYMYSGDYNLMFDSYLNHLEMVPTDMQKVKSKLQMVMRMDVNSNLTEMLREKLLQKAQNNPDDTVMAEMLLWYSLQTKDFDMAYRQARSLDVRFDNGDKSMIELANVAFSNNDYKTATKAFDYIKNKKEKSIYYSENCQY